MELCNLDTGYKINNKLLLPDMMIRDGRKYRKGQIIIIQNPMGNLTEKDMRNYRKMCLAFTDSSKEEI